MSFFVAFARLLDQTMIYEACVVLAIPTFFLAAANRQYGRPSTRSPIDARAAAKRSRGKFFAYVFAALIAAAFASSGVVSLGARAEINQYLNRPIQNVSVNGQAVLDSAELIADMKNMRSTIGHHSGPRNETISVSFHSVQGDFVVDLHRDSDVPTEYWAYNPDFPGPFPAETGHVFTTALDQF